MKKKHNRFEEMFHDAGEPIPKKTAKEAGEMLLSDDITGYDRKLITNTIVELCETAKMFKQIRNTPKITIFGSARTSKSDPDYVLCKEFSKQMADLGYMIITGAGPGIMEAGHEGAGPEKSIGVNIDLPFEQSANPFVLDSDYLITYRYFFTRKLTFVREADAVVLFPGGYGTMDEAFETLTLIQTGRAMPVPFVLMEHEGGHYWERWANYVKEGLLDHGTISAEDMYLFRRFDNTAEAADYINNFFRRYHSLRYVGDTVVVRLNTPLPPALLEDLNKEYKDFLGEEGMKASEPLEAEQDEPALLHLPRLVFNANYNKPVELYCLIRSLNREVATSSTRRQDREELIHPNPRPSRVKNDKKKD